MKKGVIVYKSKKVAISTKSKNSLEKMLNDFLKVNKFVYCKSFKRKVSLSKLPNICIEKVQKLIECRDFL